MKLHFLSLLAVAVLVVGGCSRSAEEEAGGKTRAVKKAAPLKDSFENRKGQAQKVRKAYPRSEFTEDLSARVAEITGSEVVKDAKATLQGLMTDEELGEVRTNFLVKHFTTAELKKLARVYSSPEGKAILRKWPAYQEEWREFIGPVVMEALSNSSEAPKEGGSEEEVVEPANE